MLIGKTNDPVTPLLLKKKKHDFADFASHDQVLDWIEPDVVSCITSSTLPTTQTSTLGRTSRKAEKHYSTCSNYSVFVCICGTCEIV